MMRRNASSGAVEIVNEAGVLQWSGKPLGYDASVVLPIGGANDAIVLLDRDANLGRGFRNLLRFAANGWVVWRAELPDGPTGPDSYVAVEWGVGGQLFAFSWSCFRVRLNVDSGQILDQVFTK